ncbi:hypothetical protein GQR58_029599 [Nymphon striatum]|nr:hypothetical protein GQR58_029599 [Nymphon striatum]
MISTLSKNSGFGLLFALGLGLSNAAADSRPYSYFSSNLTEYFSNTAYLPVLPLPNGENPGDIYSSFDVLRPTYLARANACFENVVVDKIGATAANSNLARVTLSFVNPRVDSLTDLQVMGAISTPASDCADALLAFDLKEGGFLRLVPAIIQEVIYAKQSFAFHYEADTELKAEAEIDSQLKKLGDVKVKADSVRANDSSFSFTSDVDLPLAWRPAFISKDDVERMRELEANGFFLKLKRFLGFRSESLEEAEAIKSEFYELVPRPEEIFEQMTTGSATKFDAKNPVHLRYLERRGKVLAMSIDLFTG